MGSCSRLLSGRHPGFTRPLAAVQGLLRKAAEGKRWKRIGYEANFAVLAPSWNSAEILVPVESTKHVYQTAFPGCELVDVTALFQFERRRKTPYEADRLRIASEISCLGLDAFEHAIAPGVPGVELAAIVEHEIMRNGTGYKRAVRVRGYAQVGVGRTRPRLVIARTRFPRSALSRTGSLHCSNWEWSPMLLGGPDAGSLRGQAFRRAGQGIRGGTESAGSRGICPPPRRDGGAGG